MGKSKGQNTETRIKIIFQLIKKLSGSNYFTIRELSNHFEYDENTIYSYKNTIEDLGYDFDKKGYKYKIKSYLDKKYRLSEKENQIVNAAINAANNITKTEKELLIKKLQSNENLLTPDLMNLLSQIEIIEQIKYAIQHKKHIIIQKYRTTNQHSNIRDRQVMPLHFEENKKILQAFEDGIVKSYRINRMAGVEVLPTEKNEYKSVQFPWIDPFGLSGFEKYKIHLWMTKRAFEPLNEEFPDVALNIKAIDNADYPYELNQNVADYEGIGRFVLGMMSEIKIIENDAFKKYLKEKIKNLTLF